MNVINYILGLIYPKRCIFCSKPIKLYAENNYVCEECTDKEKGIYVKNCIKCGNPLENHANPYCNECQAIGFLCKDGVSVFYYDDIRDTIFHFKYTGYETDANILGKYMAECIVEKCTEMLSADLIVPVPISKKKQRKRGFNQSTLLAEKISSEIGIEYNADVLVRVKNTVPQSKLSSSDRKYNVMNVFEHNGKCNITGKNIILVDDIYTTGSTIEECARVLMLAGAENVYFATLARTI